MRNKKLFICMLTILATSACLGFSSCKEDKPTPPTVIVDIQQEEEVLNVLGETTLSVLTENATSAVEWSSSDETVATVEDGVVTAWNVGSATITATANGVSDVCRVEVLRSTDAPILSVSRTQISVDKDSEYTVTASVKWLGEDVTDKVKLNWELGSGAQEGVATITPKANGAATVKGVSVGETDYYVSAMIGDVYVNQKLSVKVCDSSVWFESKDLEVGDNGNFLLTMTAIDEDGNPVAMDIPAIQAYRDGEEISNVNYTWSSVDETIVKIEGGKLIAQRAGTVDVCGVYEGNELVITVSIERQVIRLNDIVNFELADLRSAAINIPNGESGKVYLNEVEIGSLNNGEITLEAANYPTMSRELGKREIVAKTDKATYVITANLYSMLIETPEELDAWHGYAFENGDDGYYALANNIDYNGVYTGSRNWDNSGYRWANPDTTGFKGIFDGNGYIIDGLSIEDGFRGFVTLLQSEGVIKNVAFTNASYSAIGAFVCQWGCGTIENVYVQYATDARMGYWDKNATFGGAFMATDNTRNMTGKMTIKNCFVDASRTMLEHDNQSYIGGYMQYDKNLKTWNYDGVYAKLSDVYVVGPAQTAQNGEAKLHYNDLAEDSENYALYHSASEMAADSATQARIAQWDSTFWGVKGGVPMPLSVIALGDLLTVNQPNSSIYYTFKGSRSVYVGKDYSFTVTPIKAGFDEFIVFVNGVEIKPENEVYTVKNVQGDLDIKVAHGYIESGASTTTVEYTQETDTWTVNNAVLASSEGVRAHGNAYISKEYIAYMMSQGYTKLQFTVKPDKAVAVQVLYRYNGQDLVAYSNADLAANTEAKEITIDLTVASDLEIWGTNNRGSGSAIKDQGSYLIVTGLLFSK